MREEASDVVVVVVFLPICVACGSGDGVEDELRQQEPASVICAKTANSLVIMLENVLMWQSVTIVVFQDWHGFF
ncbi:hypothetical protein RHGRI_032853 [Rhododendron griersonianum]|uniref:Secreted protein n=1 Tax=Rhododendron griersonianum TaxID=479676 RepID=A0AAV6IDY9_9ERIC|nr:hypothetical protein RHGRI_032853 [Rhododendron griersonianum]